MIIVIEGVEVPSTVQYTHNKVRNTFSLIFYTLLIINNNNEKFRDISIKYNVFYSKEKCQ